MARDISEAASYFVSYRLPELYAGIERRPGTFPVLYPQANMPQAWAAGSVFHLLQAMLGLRRMRRRDGSTSRRSCRAGSRRSRCTGSLSDAHASTFISGAKPSGAGGTPRCGKGRSTCAKRRGVPGILSCNILLRFRRRVEAARPANSGALTDGVGLPAFVTAEFDAACAFLSCGSAGSAPVSEGGEDKMDEIGEAPDGCELPLNILNWRLVRTTGSVPAPEWTPTDTPVSDGEMDTDGPVHSASALGFTLGQRPFFFEHDREDGPAVDGKKTLGSWYRLYDNPVTEKYNHGMQYQNDVALWVAEDFLATNVGPLPRSNGFSEWP